MYKRKIKEDLDCGIVLAMKVFGTKWKPCIIDSIHKGNTRPSEIHKSIPEASPRVLDMQLSELLKQGVVTKTTTGGFPLASEYLLTTLGISIVPIIEQLDKWGSTHKETLKEKLVAYQ